MKDLFALIREDHEQLKRHLNQMISTSLRGYPLDKGHFDVLRSLLLSHSRAEEHVLYDALKRNQATERLAFESYEQHHLTEGTLRELEHVSDPKVLTAKLSILKETLEHHMEIEETEVFREAAQIFNPADSAQIAETFLDLKEQIQSDILGEPVPRYEEVHNSPPPAH